MSNLLGMIGESEWCECGVTLMGDPGEGDGLCALCAGAPHGRECCCDECKAYWQKVYEESEHAAEEANRQLLCSCGWTGPYIEHHRDFGDDCEVRYRHRENAEFWRSHGWNSEAWTPDEVTEIESRR